MHLFSLKTLLLVGFFFFFFFFPFSGGSFVPSDETGRQQSRTRRRQGQ